MQNQQGGGPRPQHEKTHQGQQGDNPNRRPNPDDKSGQRQAEQNKPGKEQPGNQNQNPNQNQRNRDQQR